MFLKIKYHFFKLLLFVFIILNGCQLQEPNKSHGIVFLENRADKLIINKSNKNDIIEILGTAHIKSLENDNIWMYLERTLSKGKYHKLGQHVLKSNNTLVLEFDKYGVLITKKLYDKEDIQKIAFSKEKTENKLTQKSFIESFLQSIKSKMYGNK